MLLHTGTKRFELNISEGQEHTNRFPFVQKHMQPIYFSQNSLTVTDWFVVGWILSAANWPKPQLRKQPCCPVILKLHNTNMCCTFSYPKSISPQPAAAAKSTHLSIPEVHKTMPADSKFPNSHGFLHSLSGALNLIYQPFLSLQYHSKTHQSPTYTLPFCFFFFFYKSYPS